MRKDKPPLPVTEMITNSHSIPSISHWLMEFKRKLSYTTKRRIRQVETDYSWALINSVLLSFNKENISVYLTRAFEMVSGQTERIPSFTVLHLGSAHIMKAVSPAFGKKTGDRGTQEYATFSFAFLLNCTSMQVAIGVFYHVCAFWCRGVHSFGTTEQNIPRQVCFENPGHEAGRKRTSNGREGKHR